MAFGTGSRVEGNADRVEVGGLMKKGGPGSGDRALLRY